MNSIACYTCSSLQCKKSAVNVCILCVGYQKLLEGFRIVHPYWYPSVWFKDVLTCTMCILNAVACNYAQSFAALKNFYMFIIFSLLHCLTGSESNCIPCCVFIISSVFCKKWLNDCFASSFLFCYIKFIVWTSGKYSNSKPV